MTLGRLPLIAAVVAVALVAGCAQSKVDRDAAVTVRGKLLLPDGSPAAGVEVALVRVPDIGEVLFQGMVVAGTLFTACLADEPPPVCKTVQSTKTSRRGEYVFRMRGHDVQGTIGQASYFHLGAVAPKRGGELTGPNVDVNFLIQREKLTMPTLQFWRAGDLEARAGQRRVALDWTRKKGANGYLAHFTVADGQSQVWRQSVKPGARIDARALEDLRGGFHLTTSQEKPGPDTTFTITHASQRIAFHGRAGAPASRSAACSVRGEKGQIALEPCALTDGAYQKSFPQQECEPPPSRGPSASPTPSAPPCQANTSIQVDLGIPRRIEAVFNHGLILYADAVIETSDDGEHWTRRGTLDEDAEYGRLTLNGVIARYVRLRPHKDASQIEELRELSVWAR